MVRGNAKIEAQKKNAKKLEQQKAAGSQLDARKAGTHNSCRNQSQMRSRCLTYGSSSETDSGLLWVQQTAAVAHLEEHVVCHAGVNCPPTLPTYCCC
jgi:hypothetical protein